MTQEDRVFNATLIRGAMSGQEGEPGNRETQLLADLFGYQTTPSVIRQHSRTKRKASEMEVCVCVRECVDVCVCVCVCRCVCVCVCV
jgi:hypothetical protein